MNRSIPTPTQPRPGRCLAPEDSRAARVWLFLCLLVLALAAVRPAEAEPKLDRQPRAERPVQLAQSAKRGGKKTDAPNPADTREEAARLLRENEILARRAALASADSFYLLLDPGRNRLMLKLQAATLQDYGVLGLEVGAPRVLFVPRPLPKDWQGRIWKRGELDPPRDLDRKEIVISTLGDTAYADSVTTSFGIPLTPDEKYPVPPRYHIRYEGGLSLEVRLPTATDSIGLIENTFSRRTHAWWADLKDALRPSERSDRVRLRVILSKDDAKSLYRAIPPDTKLLIVPGGPVS